MVRWPYPKNISLPRIKAARLAVARARHKPSDKKRTAWEVAEFYWTRFTTLALNAVAISVAGFALYVLWESITKKVISIAPIYVPQVLAANGYTPEVAAERLQNALNDIVNHAHSMRGGPDVAMQTDLPSIVVPSTALSTESLAAQIRRFFRINNRRNVSGELTIVEKKLWLRLRMNGRDLYVSSTGGDLEHPDDLFAPAAQMVLEETDPYIFAVYLHNRNSGKSLEIAKRIISERPVNDPIIAWAHSLIGTVLRDQLKTDEAIAEIRKALELDPGWVPAHIQMGFALSDQGKTEEAIAEYRAAIELNPRNGGLHAVLGFALNGQGRRGDHRVQKGNRRVPKGDRTRSS